MFTPKRNSTLNAPNSAKVTRSQSLKTKHEFFSPGPSGGLNMSSMLNPNASRISFSISSIYNDAILESYKAPLPIRINELIFQLKSSSAGQDLSSQTSATILQNGHVCFVYERKLYIWKLKKSIKVQNTTTAKSTQVKKNNLKNLFFLYICCLEEYSML